MNTKDDLAKTAFNLFLNNGYRASTMSELVKQSGLSKGAFYHYFKSKKDVYDYVLEHYFLIYYRTVNWQSLDGLNFKELEISLSNNYKNFVEEIDKITEGKISNYFIMFFEAYNSSEYFQKTVKDFYQNLEQLLIKNLVKNNLTKTEAQIKAVKLIAQYEGMFFYHAVFPEKEPGKYLGEIK